MLQPVAQRFVDREKEVAQSRPEQVREPYGLEAQAGVAEEQVGIS